MTSLIRLEMIKAHVALPWLMTVVVTATYSSFIVVFGTDERIIGYPNFSCIVVSSYNSLPLPKRIAKASKHLSLSCDSLALVCAHCCKMCCPYIPPLLRERLVLLLFGEAEALWSVSLSCVLLK